LLKIIYIIATISMSIFSSGAQAHQFRLTETSITENGRVHTAPQTRLVTKGYGLTYILESGLGFSLTQLNTTGGAGAVEIELNHSYIDVSLTKGTDWLMTFGYGIGISGDAKISGESTKEFRATSFHLGAGYRYSNFELYWINRLNFMKYDLEEYSPSATSTHYQLGLGYKIPS
jgi:hypothetical protein